MPLPTPASLGLPAKPSSGSTSAAPSALKRPAPHPSTPSTSASASTSTLPNCSICDAADKYKCPRCAARYCSVACRNAHQSKTGCDGVRDPAAFVPLAKFTQGTWDGDYAMLEATRRQVAAFGEGVSADEVRGASTRGRGRGRGAAQVGRQRKPKTDGLKWALAQVGAEVDILPDGMQKRRQNQSSWNHKTQSLAITLHLLPSGRLATDDKVPVAARVPVLPNAATLASLLPEALRTTDVVYAMPYHIPRRRSAELRPPGRGAYFPPLPGSKGLDVALHGTAFVEFPVVHVFARDEWEHALRYGMVRVMPGLQPPREAAEGAGEQPAKRARVGETVEGSALAGLGDYGDSDEEAEEGVGEGAEGGEGEGEAEAEGEGGDVTIDPAMAEALGKALEADFGPA
ncbi:hypothetical protein CC85DRAFT_312920 [Cutaneotrichosporon oleaginosum]|uniref:HIT-type domain-containing protein n=1 Tax=Cutaneotrichosporon oleaginosum TaxID=879819 RepID=A0A0J0XJA4_9TREE|nr:uncharacterized protein CC85DRAFT_312920 [Cutaneotrichosporon oleaginosum]KLT41190.1 hypothetical protein CC85DRAFT_312920 [Cutaneotrichosporon oleaginosum]TXT14093.1 hypothetical protein COLE_00286 [Cutaneotrichosporon oleaginosum]